jgi:DegV family protein with EDD domain
MSRIAIVTDSACDLPDHDLDAYGIRVVPLTLDFGGEVLTEGRDLSAAALWRRLRETGTPPRTFAPSPEAFEACYRQLLSEGAETIFSIHISSGFSATYRAAYLARRTFPEADIEVIDTRSASLGTGLVALNAARMARRGDKNNVAAEIRRCIESQRLLVTVDSLEWLKNSGRIGRAASLAGTVMSVKPLLAVEDGILAPREKVRGPVRVINRMVEISSAAIPPLQPVQVAIAHGDAFLRASALREAVEAALDVREMVFSLLGVGIGANTGPGTLGLAVLPWNYELD